MNNYNMPELIDITMLDISKRVAKLEMQTASNRNMDYSDPYYLCINTFGDYILTIVLQTNHNVLYQITQNMKRGFQPNEEEIPVYSSEYFNILCGHIVTSLNQISHLSARFGVPRFVHGVLEEHLFHQSRYCFERYYQCPYGVVRIEIHCNDALYKQ